MNKFVIRPPQKRPSPTDSPTAADSKDPGTLHPGEKAPTNSGSSASSASNTGNTKCRKYQDSYLNYGFISFSRSKESLPQPQCIICTKVLANECMRPSKLIRHLQTTHPQYRDMPRAFERKAKELTHSQNEMREVTATDKKLLKISYTVAEKIAKAKKGHTIAETLILPCATEIVKELFGEDKSKQLTKITLSNNTVKRRITTMSEDVRDQLSARLRGNNFALQIDESTDVPKMAQLLA